MKRFYVNAILILSLFFVAFTLSAQQKVEIGQQCPDIELSNILNYKNKKALLSEFNDKPILIDFWFIRCPACWDLMTHLDSLHKANNGKFNIIMATTEKEEKVIAFFKKHPNLSNPEIPIATNLPFDSGLMKMFPHRKEPHEVWIGNNRIVKAITTKEEVTQDNITSFMQGKPLNLPEKIEFMNNLGMGGQELFLTDHQYNKGKNQLCYSYFGQLDPKLITLKWAVEYNKKFDGVRILCQNCVGEVLYNIAYDADVDMDLTEKKKLSKNDKFFTTPYCYELVLKDTSVAKAKKMMQIYLDNYFSFKSELKELDVPCYVLSRIKDSNKFISQITDNKSKFDQTDNQVIVKNVSIKAVIDNRLYNDLPYEVLNETNYDGKVDIILPLKSDINNLKKELNKYGLDITLQKRKRERIYIQNMN
ncbi:redoxin domain-containing protein [Chitinophaga sp. HK235]|uniref:TlpA family protein disulfide reductase n=1 Tax=Chitinophaga sp. HK235 TaxID=2952571 RepID=UPI001BAE2702|nr:redoxin domain-containing protein [Chitinophaga sp. HK235]